MLSKVVHEVRHRLTERAEWEGTQPTTWERRSRRA